jgi:hypothetical protein
MAKRVGEVKGQSGVQQKEAPLHVTVDPALAVSLHAYCRASGRTKKSVVSAAVFRYVEQQGRLLETLEELDGACQAAGLAALQGGSRGE